MRETQGYREHGGGHRLAHHSTQPHISTIALKGMVLCLHWLQTLKFTAALSLVSLKGPSDPLHCLFLLISASAHLDGVQQGLRTDTYNAKGTRHSQWAMCWATTTERLRSTWQM